MRSAGIPAPEGGGLFGELLVLMLVVAFGYVYWLGVKWVVRHYRKGTKWHLVLDWWPAAMAVLTCPMALAHAGGSPWNLALERFAGYSLMPVLVLDLPALFLIEFLRGVTGLEFTGWRAILMPLIVWLGSAVFVRLARRRVDSDEPILLRI
jgi:hypothetical protein